MLQTIVREVSLQPGLQSGGHITLFPKQIHPPELELEEDEEDEVEPEEEPEEELEEELATHADD